MALLICLNEKKCGRPLPRIAAELFPAFNLSFTDPADHGAVYAEVRTEIDWQVVPKPNTDSGSYDLRSCGESAGKSKFIIIKHDFELQKFRLHQIHHFEMVSYLCL